MRRSLYQGVGLVAAACAISAHADFISPDGYGWNRGDQGSAYFAWDVFSSTSGGNDPAEIYPDPLPAGWTDPDVVETTGNGIITSTGRIYSPFGPINVQVTVPNYDEGAAHTTVLVQVRTIGNELAYEDARLDGSVEPADIIEVSRQASDFGFEIETLFVFEIDGNAGVYVIDIPTAEAHCAIGAIAVDTYAAAESCAADFNGDGSVNTQDVIGFLNAWAAGDGAADINGDGSVNTQDVIAYLNLWVAGC